MFLDTFKGKAVKTNSISSVTKLTGKFDLLIYGTVCFFALTIVVKQSLMFFNAESKIDKITWT